MDTQNRGFASMSKDKQRAIASKGGHAAHKKGTAHEWTSDEAREAGRKGGMAMHTRRQVEALVKRQATKPVTEDEVVTQ